MMAGLAYKYLAFLAVFHVLMFHAQAGGIIDSNNPQNQHRKFITEFSDGNLTEKAAVGSQDSGLIGDFFSPVLALSGFINTVIGILISPYSAINATELPNMISMLITTLMGVTESFVAYKIVRGKV